MSTPTFAQIQRERAELRDHIERVTGAGHDAAGRIAVWLHGQGVRGDPTDALMSADLNALSKVCGVGRRSMRVVRMYREETERRRRQITGGAEAEAAELRVLCAPSRLLHALRRIHDGTDRGELKALLVEEWGPSPPIVCACCGESGHPMNRDVCADSEACVMRARREDPGPSITSATGDSCICAPGWGHRSDGPHPRERVMGCDTNRANRAVGGASDYIDEMLIAQRGFRLTELL